MERQQLNVFRMRLLGAEVREVAAGTATLKVRSCCCVPGLPPEGVSDRVTGSYATAAATVSAGRLSDRWPMCVWGGPGKA
jgi:hypothetical protein